MGALELFAWIATPSAAAWLARDYWLRHHCHIEHTDRDFAHKHRYDR